MILEHYSKVPLEWPPRSYVQAPLGTDGNFKPKGLWVSVRGEYDWPWWCRAEDFQVSRLAMRQIVHLTGNARILTIESEEQILEFDAIFGVDHPLSPTFTWHQIDWGRVASEHDGIVIAPYLWSCRLPMEERDSPRSKVSNWYYPWDCASGCIWNAGAIDSFELVNENLDFVKVA